MRIKVLLILGLNHFFLKFFFFFIFIPIFILFFQNDSFSIASLKPDIKEKVNLKKNQVKAFKAYNLKGRNSKNPDFKNDKNKKRKKAYESNTKATHPHSALSNAINQLIAKSHLPKKTLSLMITSSEGFRYTLNHKKLFNTASLVKIIVAAACFSILPHDHQFKTKLFIGVKDKKELQDGFYTLKGNLYLKGGGDPSFTSESLWNLVNQFTREGIRRITGDIIVDSSLFDSKMYDGRRKVRVESSYDAPVEALSFNWNSVNIFVRPGKALNQPALVFVDPLNEYIKLINRSKTRQGIKTKIQVRRIRNLHVPGDSIYVEGFIGLEAKEKAFYRNITQPSLWTGYNLKSFLEQRSIQVLGTVKHEDFPKNLELVSSYSSLPLRKSVSDMMKFSNNFVAEMLTKHLSLQADISSAGSISGGLLEINRFLESLSISKENYVLVSPSGLSRENRFRIQDIHRVLDLVKKDFRIFPDFLSSLPANAVDGTLKHRINDEPHLKAWIRAKTGTLNHVAGLAGYAGTEKGSFFTFSFLFNSPKKYKSTSKKARKLRQRGEKLIDEISKILLKF